MTWFIYDYLNFLAHTLIIIGAISLKEDKRKFNQVKLLRNFSIIILSFEILFRFIQPIELYFAFERINWPFSWIFDFIFFIKSITLYSIFFFFGSKNRNNYGNYLRSAAFFGFIMVFTNAYQTIFFSPETLTAEIDGVFLLITHAINVVVGMLASLYIFFFGFRIKNVNFLILPVFLIYTLLHGFFTNIYYFIGNELYTFSIAFIIIFQGLIGTFVSLRFFEIGIRFRRGFRVFITHTVDDFKRYRINEIAKFLESQKEIGRVHYCEIDLTGNIDEWMRKTVPRCNFLIFLSTESSLNSDDCSTELALARSNNLQIIPILGVGVDWDELKKLNIDREFGSTYDPMEFETFCNELYEHILRYKKALESKTPEKKRK